MVLYAKRMFNIWQLVGPFVAIWFIYTGVNEFVGPNIVAAILER